MTTPTPTPTAHTPLSQLVWLALALSMGAALSLGITRFSYGLLLPPMRHDLNWSYTLAGGMNTVNALGYLLGALVTPRLLQRWGASRVLMWGAVLASALVFIAGGLLAARLGALQPARGGWLIGLYYGGTGFGIMLSAVLVPAVLEAAAGRPHGWAWAWWMLAGTSGVATLILRWPARVLQSLAPPVPAGSAPVAAFDWRPFSFALSGYAMFGMGYIGYMTFVIALLREQGASSAEVTVFYALLGLAVIASSRIWARLLDKYKGGQVLALLNGLLGLATLLPALTSSWPVVFASGLLFGAVFLSLVASTTALVRHNLPHAAWGAGISAFTIVFAFGQIVGPTLVGYIADGPGGLARGLIYSAAALWVGAALASRQRALS